MGISSHYSQDFHALQTECKFHPRETHFILWNYFHLYLYLNYVISAYLIPSHKTSVETGLKVTSEINSSRTNEKKINVSTV